MRDLYSTMLAFILCALAHGFRVRIASTIAEPPISDGAIAACGHCPAFAVKPNHAFAIASMLRAILHGDAFGFFLAAPTVRVTIGAARAAIGDGAIAQRRSGCLVVTHLHVLDALAFFISAAGRRANLRMCNRVCARRDKYRYDHQL